MSTLPAQPSLSPPPRWLSNDGSTSSALQDSGDAEQGDEAKAELAPPEVSGGILPSPLIDLADAPSFPPVSPPPVTLTQPQPADDGPPPDETPASHEPAEDAPLPPPDFQPFFTLVADAETGEHHHPTVHYLFSDDDPEILTAAALNALDDLEAGQQDKSQQDASEERCVIVDLAADGKSVTGTSSLSANWQAVNATVSAAPSWGEERQRVDRGLMLSISGQEERWSNTGRAKKQRREHAGRGLEELVKTFHERLEGLDEVLGDAQAQTQTQGQHV